MRGIFKAGEEFDFLTKDEVASLIREYFPGLAASLMPPLVAFPQGNSRGSTYDVSGTQATIDLGTPPKNYVWNVMRVSICGADPRVVVQGVAMLFAGDPAPAQQGKQPQPSEFRDNSGFSNPSTAIPIPDPWGRHQVTIRPGEHLYVVVTGLVAGPGILYANAQVVQELAGQEQEYEA